MASQFKSEQKPKDISLEKTYKWPRAHKRCRLMEIKTIMRYNLTWIRMAIIKKNLQTINAGEDAEKRGLSYTTGGNLNGYNHDEEEYRGSLKNYV